MTIDQQREKDRMTNAILVLLLFSSTVFGSDWPQWRGPGRDGHVPADWAVPETLPAAPKVLWHIPIGNGVASPVIAGNKVIYLDNQEDKETVHAVDAAAGKELWSHSLDEVHRDKQSVPGPRCTPVIDSDRVYVQSCRGELKCLSAADGHEIWQTNYVKDFGAIYIGEKGKAVGASRHGNVGSPIIDGGHLIACVGGKDASVVCFDKLTGTVVWKSQDDTPGYAAPFIATVEGVRQVICFTSDAVMALNVTDGTLLWRTGVKTGLGRHVTTPVVVGDRVAVASFTAGLIGLKVTKEAGSDAPQFKVEQEWVNKESAINFSSPVAVGHYLYGPGPTKNLFCVDIETGKQEWSQTGYFTTAGGQVHAGLLVMGHNILVLTNEGELVLFAADPKAFHEISKVQVCGSNWCNPAYADGDLCLRDAKELYCVRVMP
jgi:outer membrane protein assembly factor BamB